jgi:cobalt/nickel transport system permease protein
MGGTLAAVLVGPWTAILCMSTVFIVQCLLFADGGITALGTNIMLMGVVTAGVGWLLFKLVTTALPKRIGVVAPAAAVGAFVSVPVAAIAFTLLYAAGGTADIPLGSLAAAMIGWHTLIGIGEGVITFLAVGSILAVRPDLVYGARPALAARELVVSTPGASA